MATPHPSLRCWHPHHSCCLRYKCRVDNSSTGLNEHTIVDMAQAIVQSGLADVGYEYVNLEWAPLQPHPTLLAAAADAAPAARAATATWPRSA